MAHRAAEKQTAVVLINMGGPENGAEVHRFIRNLFADPHITGMPQPFRWLFATLLSSLRAPKVRAHYDQIGGGSPLKRWTTAQAEKLRQRLIKRDPNIVVTEAYSYSGPSIIESLFQLRNARSIIALPLYPQYSTATLGSIYSDLENRRKEFNLGDRLRIASPFYDHPEYISSSADLIRPMLDAIDPSRPFRVIFSAHALPESFILKGDPYRRQIEHTVTLIRAHLPELDWRLAFQSKIGPVEWMKPSTIDTVRRAAHEGVSQLIVVPIGFVCDHIETLYELDIELRGIAESAGVTIFLRAPVFNDSDRFIDLLVSLVKEELA